MRRLEVQDQGVDEFASFWGLSSWLSGGHLLTVSSHDLFSVLMGRERETSGVSSSFHGDISSIELEPQPYDLF